MKFHEPVTDAAAHDFAELAEALNNSALRSARPTNRALIAALNTPRPETCFTQAGHPRILKTKGKWQTAAAEAGKPKTEGVEAYDAANAQYMACHTALERLMGTIAGELLSRVAAEMDGLLDNWRSYKHAAALLDFDDLLYTARNLLAGTRTSPPGAGASVRACSRRRVSGHRSAADRHSLAALRRGSKATAASILWLGRFVPGRCFWSAIPSKRSIVSAAPT